MEPTSLSAADIAIADQLRQFRPSGDNRVNSPAAISSPSASTATDVRANVLFQAGWCAALAAVEREHPHPVATNNSPLAVAQPNTSPVSPAIRQLNNAAHRPLSWMAVSVALFLACTGLLVLQVWQIQTGQLAFGTVRSPNQGPRPLVGDPPGSPLDAHSPRVLPSPVPRKDPSRGIAEAGMPLTPAPESQIVVFQPQSAIPLMTGQPAWLGELSTIWGAWVGPRTPHSKIRSAQDVASKPKYWQVRHNLDLPETGRAFSGSKFTAGPAITSGQQDLLWQEIEADLQQL